METAPRDMLAYFLESRGPIGWESNIPFAVFLLLVTVFLLGFALTFLGYQALAVGDQEGLEACEEIFFGDAEIPVQKEEELAFHEIDLGKGEAKSFIALHYGVSGPMLVLRARVVEVLGGEDE